MHLLNNFRTYSDMVCNMLCGNKSIRVVELYKAVAESECSKFGTLYVKVLSGPNL